MFEFRTKRSRVIGLVVLTVLAIPYAFPILVMLQNSLRVRGLGNYVIVLQREGFFRFFLNTVIIAAGTIVIVYVCAMLAGFAFAKLRVPLREGLFYSFLVALTLPSLVILVPLFLTMQRLGLLNTYWAVILPLAAGGIPFSILLVRNYVAGIPDELLDAARVDGCSELAVFFRIILPLSHPIGAVIVLWTFLGSWNEFLLPLLFLQDPKMQSITQVPQTFATFYGGDPPVIIAASVLISLPVLIMYLSLQRYFEKGMTGGALK